MAWIDFSYATWEPSVGAADISMGTVTAQSGVPSLEFGGIGPYFPGGYMVPVIEWGQYNVRFYCPAEMGDGDYCKVVESLFQKPFPKKDEIGSMLWHMTRFDGGRKYVRDTWLVPPWVTPDETYPETHEKFHSYNILVLMHGNGTIDEEHFSRFMMKLDGQDLIVPKALERTRRPRQKVDQLLFDAEVCFLTSHMGPLFPGDDDDEHRWLSNLEDFNSFISFARASPTLRAKVLEDGIVRYVKDIRAVVKAGSPVVLCTCQNLVNDYFFLHDDGTLSPDARRDLALGTDADGWVVLAHRSGGDVLRFQVVDAKGTTPQALTLQSEVGRGVVIAEETMVGPSQVRKLRLGKASDAVIVVADGSIVRFASDDALALHVGDPAFELARKQNQELYAAAKEGNLATMEQLIGEGADVNWPREHESLGHVAAREGQSQALKVLLAHGFDVNTRPCGAVFQPCPVELMLCR
ncbi:unnamed protein product [Symbiodinium sp. CCMP2592]|nr:unnamed protein product [Symbiodinium sp. CCMP2592]